METGMGFFGKLIGATDDTVMQTGLLGRGEVTGVQMSGMTLQSGNGVVERKCTISLKVMLDNVAPYDAVAVQRLQEIVIPQLAGGAVLAVRVDPNDHSKVFLDFASELPEVTVPKGEGRNSAAWVLENGKPIKVVLVQSQPAKMKNADGVDIYALTLTPYEGVDTPYQLVVGNAVPATALPLLYPGSKLHAKLGDQPDAVVIDWAAGAVSS
jgi:hypothetical protein